MSDQEIAALTIVACAAIYLLRRFLGPASKSTPADAIVSSRLARGLRAAERRRDDKPRS